MGPFAVAADDCAVSLFEQPVVKAATIARPARTEVVRFTNRLLQEYTRKAFSCRTFASPASSLVVRQVACERLQTMRDMKRCST